MDAARGQPTSYATGLLLLLLLLPPLGLDASMRRGDGR